MVVPTHTPRADDDSALIYDFAPLVMWSPPRAVDGNTSARIIEHFEHLLERGEKHAVAYCNRAGTNGLPPRERKALAEWASLPRVRARSVELCVTVAAVVTNPLARGAVTAVLWVWRPPMPFIAAPTVEGAIDACLDELDRASVPRAWTRASVRDAAVARLASIAAH